MNNDIRSRAYTIEEVLPHKPPMQLLDGIRYVCEERAGATAIVQPQRSFTDEQQGLPWWATVELMAQTIGVWVGVKQLERNEAIRLGFLLGTRKLQADFDWLPNGCKVEIDVTLNVINDEGLAVFDCELRAENKQASARLNVFQPHNVESYLGIE